MKVKVVSFGGTIPLLQARVGKENKFPASQQRHRRGRFEVDSLWTKVRQWL